MKAKVQSLKFKVQSGLRAGAPSIARPEVPLLRAEQCSALRYSCVLARFAALFLFAFNTFAAAPAASAPADLRWQSLVLPSALVVVGPWGDDFRWREALHAQGILHDDGYRAHNIYHRPFVQMYRMPANAADYRRYSVVILANVDAHALGEERLKILQQFVADGGGLVVLGGFWAFNRGGYKGTPLEAMLPVRFDLRDDIPALPAGAPLAVAPTATWKLSAAFDRGPRSFYTHEFAPKEKSVVEILAGEKPAVVTGEFGRGRVVACALTIHGKALPNAPGFWDWPDWPRVLGHAVQWAGETRPLRPAAPAGAVLKPVSDEELLQLRVENKAVNIDFLTRFAAAPTEPVAAALFNRVVGDGESAKGFALPSDALEALARFAKTEWFDALRKMGDRGNPDLPQRNTALELLGATRAPKTAATLLDALSQPDVTVAAVDGLQRLGDAAHAPTLVRIHKQAAAAANFVEDREFEPDTPASLRARHLTAHSAVALYRLGERGGVERAARLFAFVRLQQRIHLNAAKRRTADTDPTGQAIRKHILDKAHDLALVEAYLLKSAGPVPESQRAALVDFARTATEEAEVRWVAAALLNSPGGAHWAALAEAKDGIIRRAALAMGRVR